MHYGSKHLVMKKFSITLGASNTTKTLYTSLAECCKILHRACKLVLAFINK